ncbi:hypothetical protein DFH05DRAFT_779735 [Lentinula detonsa]|uniref:Secreted protein n=1 Tax=Lentinula detonsa TaxID=2804962 RepID=A0A9W8P572_9AGAR|nr:hypothetical protein DFH05DRAFT_779735 [Lentinula detonsa]
MRFFFAYLLLWIIAVVYARPLNDPRRDLIIDSRTHWYVRSQGDTNAKANGGVNGHANGVNGHTNGNDWRHISCETIIFNVTSVSQVAQLICYRMSRQPSLSNTNGTVCLIPEWEDGNLARGE